MSENISASTTSWQRTKNIVLMITAAILGIANWNNARVAVTTSYHELISHFTDDVEIKLLDEVRVGSNLEYMERLFGTPRIMKVSEMNRALSYRYYRNPKFILTLAVIDGRVIGYQLIPLRAEFSPPIAFTDQRLNARPISARQELSGAFATDTGNLRYFMEGTKLGKDGMLFNRYLGYVEYGAAYGNPTSFSLALTELNDLLLKDNKPALAAAMQELRKQLNPNVYAIGDISLEQAAEMLLTRFEYAAYFAEHK